MFVQSRSSTLPGFRFHQADKFGKAKQRGKNLEMDIYFHLNIFMYIIYGRYFVRILLNGVRP